MAARKEDIPTGDLPLRRRAEAMSRRKISVAEASTPPEHIYIALWPDKTNDDSSDASDTEEQVAEKIASGSIHHRPFLGCHSYTLACSCMLQNERPQKGLSFFVLIYFYLALSSPSGT